MYLYYCIHTKEVHFTWKTKMIEKCIEQTSMFLKSYEGNYEGIIEYGDEVMRVNTGIGVLRIEGKELFLKQLTSECIVVTGKIKGIIFLT